MHKITHFYFKVMQRLPMAQPHELSPPWRFFDGKAARQIYASLVSAEVYTQFCLKLTQLINASKILFVRRSNLKQHYQKL